MTNRPPFTTMDDFMAGDLSYAVAVPDTPDASLTVQVRHKRVGGPLVALLLVGRAQSGGVVATAFAISWATTIPTPCL